MSKEEMHLKFKKKSKLSRKNQLIITILMKIMTTTAHKKVMACGFQLLKLVPLCCVLLLMVILQKDFGLLVFPANL
jgi:hypothetical protein